MADFEKVLKVGDLQPGEMVKVEVALNPVLLGNVAYRAQGEFEWDAKTLTPKGNDRAKQFITEPFRKGWEI